VGAAGGCAATDEPAVDGVYNDSAIDPAGVDPTESLCNSAQLRDEAVCWWS
jgi:hypothetical protein